MISQNHRFFQCIFSFDSSSIRGHVCLSLVGVHKFQRVINALKVYVINMCQGIIYNMKYVYAYNTTCNRTSIPDNVCWSVVMSASNEF
jgi:hypothetical protein